MRKNKGSREEINPTKLFGFYFITNITPYSYDIEAKHQESITQSRSRFGICDFSNHSFESLTDFTVHTFYKNWQSLLK